MEQELRIIRPESEVMTKQGLPNFVGVSEASAGSTAISMNVVIIPPGAAAEPHIHKGYETAIYILQGRARVLYGDDLAQETECQAGDFIFIPADVPHQPINLSDSEPAKAIVARNDPNEQESVVPYPARE